MSRFSRIVVAIAAFLALACAITIDPDLPDGVYQINYSRDMDSKVLALTYFDTPHDVNITAVKFNGKLNFKFGKKDVYCLNDDHRLAGVKVETKFTRADDQLKAMNLLANWCEMATYVQTSAMVVAVYNDMLWYVCNWDTWYNQKSADIAQRCSKLEILKVDGILDRCGVGHRAEIYFGGWQKTYGRSHRFGDICKGKEREQIASHQ
ncbi:hypothetical protein LLEC1_07963 [Akanthomyces lecanii]|uniref:Ecp2 effector protein domain-containing protein n=1 Tax=Cordyceps confragosa TaxID=2714763 RepID=A0A179IJM9_CORDF|nr:hypothetical protein LLEC1_07963 [Akanthomyces lecanii]